MSLVCGCSSQYAFTEYKTVYNRLPYLGWGWCGAGARASSCGALAPARPAAALRPGAAYGARAACCVAAADTIAWSIYCERPLKTLHEKLELVLPLTGAVSAWHNQTLHAAQGTHNADPRSQLWRKVSGLAALAEQLAAAREAADPYAPAGRGPEPNQSATSTSQSTSPRSGALPADPYALYERDLNPQAITKQGRTSWRGPLLPDQGGHARMATAARWAGAAPQSSTSSMAGAPGPASKVAAGDVGPAVARPGWAQRRPSSTRAAPDQGAAGEAVHGSCTAAQAPQLGGLLGKLDLETGQRGPAGGRAEAGGQPPHAAAGFARGSTGMQASPGVGQAATAAVRSPYGQRVPAVGGVGRGTAAMTPDGRPVPAAAGLSQGSVAWSPGHGRGEGPTAHPATAAVAGWSEAGWAAGRSPGAPLQAEEAWSQREASGGRSAAAAVAGWSRARRAAGRAPGALPQEPGEVWPQREAAGSRGRGAQPAAVAGWDPGTPASGGWWARPRVLAERAAAP